MGAPPRDVWDFGEQAACANAPCATKDVIITRTSNLIHDRDGGRPRGTWYEVAYHVRGLPGHPRLSCFRCRMPGSRTREDLVVHPRNACVLGTGEGGGQVKVCEMSS